MSEPPTEPAVPTAPEAERTYAMFLHLGGLAALTQIPFAGLLVPLIMWLAKKDTSPALDAHGREAVNFQLTLVIVALGIFLVGLALIAVTLGLATIVVLPLWFIAWPVLLIVDVVFCVLAAMEASKGQMYRYPFCFRFIGPARA